MSLAELGITSVKVEGRTKSEVARDYRSPAIGCTSWSDGSRPRARPPTGRAAYRPRSRRPHRNPRAVDAATEERKVRVRKELSRQGWDAGADTVRTHLLRESDTAWCLRSRRSGGSWSAAGRDTATPQAAQVRRAPVRSRDANEPWQADIPTGSWPTAPPVEILNIEDDHSRLNIASDARLTTSGHDVVASFRRAFRRHGIPARLLSDNAAAFTGKPRHGGRVALELELDLLGVRFDHSRPRHPQTCGKVCKEFVVVLHRTGLTPAKV